MQKPSALWEPPLLQTHVCNNKALKHTKAFSSVAWTQSDAHDSELLRVTVLQGAPLSTTTGWPPSTLQERLEVTLNLSGWVKILSSARRLSQRRKRNSSSSLRELRPVRVKARMRRFHVRVVKDGVQEINMACWIPWETSSFTFMCQCLRAATQHRGWRAGGSVEVKSTEADVCSTSGGWRQFSLCGRLLVQLLKGCMKVQQSKKGKRWWRCVSMQKCYMFYL